ncbi:hypothetical protein QNI19_38145 [Cytophagaceae bacterium DM2B3-1]|uniref:DUF4199 domain-containing protein n=1 Tax=Xanthocytophaga flava TaxID=3048013 RepID=A0ABT7CYG2_9BACT|nr:hypothetical protein [Xanthocytophaga flavus]MDJ1498814.1 hypothetical protein [Xanthocytophaga flavus]
MTFKLSSEPIFALVITFASTLSGYFLGIITFPKLSNEYLSQSLIDFKVLTIITCAIFFLVLLYLSLQFGFKKYAIWFWLAGVVAAISFFLITFNLYFPYENRYVIHVYECNRLGEAKYIIGTEFNSDFIKMAPDASKKTVENLILGSGCSPHKVWTAKSVERNYNTLISYYIICIFLFTSMVFFLLQAITCHLRIKPIEENKK